MAVHVITDGLSDLPPEVARELGVTVVPANVIFGDDRPVARGNLYSSYLVNCQAI